MAKRKRDAGTLTSRQRGDLRAVRGARRAARIAAGVADPRSAVFADRRREGARTACRRPVRPDDF